jgi:hypothetical protein
MRATETASRLEGQAGRGAGTDAERRAASWLAGELGAGGREVVVETFWCRPSWALAQAWHVALALAGSLVSVASPRLGAALLLAALVFVVLDALTGSSPGRRLTAARASQNVVAIAPPAPPIDAAADSPAKRTRLILTANYDAGRAGLVYRDALRRACAALRRASFGLAPGWLGWLAIAIVSLLAVVIVRLQGNHSHVLGIVQLPPTVGLVLCLALLLELGTADFSPAAGDNGTGVAVALALAHALDAAPPRHLDVEVVLAGAGEGGGIGLRRHLRSRRHERKAANTVVVGIAACSGGNPRWWLSEGPLVPLRYARRLRQLAQRIAAEEPHLGAAPYRGRGATPALAARMARLPAIAIGCLDRRGLVARSHQRTDVADAIEAGPIESAVQLGLLLIDAIDAALAEPAARVSVTPA